jgi:hypothetical protein
MLPFINFEIAFVKRSPSLPYPGLKEPFIFIKEINWNHHA